MACPAIIRIHSSKFTQHQGNVSGLWGDRSLGGECVQCIIPNGILPALLILSVEGKELHDKLVDLGEGQHLATRVLDRHRDQGDQARQTEQQWGACFFTSSESFLFQLLYHCGTRRLGSHLLDQM